MKKLYASLFFVALCLLAVAQEKAPRPEDYIKPYGKIDAADLELKSCDFEPDANAEVLFDVANVFITNNSDIVNERHKRIKIFNTNGKNNANIRIVYRGINRFEVISGLQAQTINVVNGKPEFTTVDKAQIFTEKVDKVNSALVFSFPNVKPGSVLEFKYTWTAKSTYNFPKWYFQDVIPVRYSQITTKIPKNFNYATVMPVAKPFSVNISKETSQAINGLSYNATINTRGMVNVHSFIDEPFMRSKADNILSLLHTIGGQRDDLAKPDATSWPKLVQGLMMNENFGKQFKKDIATEDAIIAKANDLVYDKLRIAYIFNEVKNTMKWNDVDSWFTNDGVVEAWQKKVGNSAEINMIVYHLLQKAGIKSYPMLVSTQDNGRVNPYSPSLYQFNKMVVYVPVDTAKYYLLDATNKYNVYDQLPDRLLNSAGMYFDDEAKTCNTIFIENHDPVLQSYFVNVDISADGKMRGTNAISSYGYNRTSRTAKYRTDGEQKFVDYLRDNNNNLKISSLKFENLEVDTLPLMQNVDFELDLAGADGGYIYFSPNVMTMLKTNPFITENRYSDVYFGYLDNTLFTGIFKMPAGYTAETLPKSTLIVMPDKSIAFRRTVSVTGNAISVRYSIDHRKPIYFKEEYPDLREFNRQMYELLNEQIVLKRS